MSPDPRAPDRDARGPAVRAGLVAGVLALALNAATAGRFVGSEDVAEFQTLAITGGIAHAGYPLPVMLFRLFGELPFGSPALRANLLAALAGALAVALAAAFGARLSGRTGAGVVAGLALALGITMWSESTRAEVYVVSLPIAVLAFLAMRRFARAPSIGSSFAAGTLVGAGLTAHLSMLSLVPVAALSLFAGLRRGAVRGFHVALALAGLAAGLTPLVYMLVQDEPGRPMNYIEDTLRPDTVAGLAGADPPATRFERAAWLLSARQYLDGHVFERWTERARELAAGVALNEYPVAGALLAALGMIVLLARRRGLEAGLLAAWIAGALFWTLYGANAGIARRMFLPAVWALAPLVAVALGALAGRSRPAFAIVAALVIALPLVRVGLAAPPAPLERSSTVRSVWSAAPAKWHPLRPDRRWDAFGRGAMAALPPRAAVLSCWRLGMVLRYFRYAEPLRDDVEVWLYCRDPRPAFARADEEGRPLFTTYPLTPELAGGRPFHRVGRWEGGELWRIDAPRESAPAPAVLAP